MRSAYHKERLLLAACLVVVVAFSWIYLFYMARDMSTMDMARVAMPASTATRLPELFSLFLMWVIMMIAMMLPSASPMVLTFLSVNQQRHKAGRSTVSAWLFIGGYVIAWSFFSLTAAIIQLTLRTFLLLSSDMAISNSYLTAAVLITAGLYQFSPFKNRCLDLCRSPLSFLMSRWQEGHIGAIRMGIEHGFYCVGCCWLLMGLLFVAGVMNLIWVMILTLIVILEKLLPTNKLIVRLSGCLLISIGLIQGVIAL